MNTTFGVIALPLITPSLTNPRKTFDPAKLQELADSIKTSGVHTPVLLRPLPQGRLDDTFRDRRPGDPLPEYELVAGERRYRASSMAGAETIPAMIRELTDDQVMEIQIVENLQRDDLTALEEAQGYQLLMDHAKINAEEVGAKIGKSRSYVFGRLKLLDLGLDGQEALRQGFIDASKALLLARIPSTALQVKALQEIIRANHPEGVMSHRMAAEHIRSRYMLKIEQAPFDHTDTTMLPRACTICPTRTGADQDIFADVMGADMCTDPDCYGNKVQQHHSRRRSELEAKGHQIIDGADARLIMPHAMSAPEGYSRLDAVQDSPTDKPLSEELASLIERGELKPVMIANPHREGELIACVLEEDVDRLLQRAGNAKAAKRAQEVNEHMAKRDAERQAQELKKAFETTWRLRTLDAVLVQAREKPEPEVPGYVRRHMVLQLVPELDREVVEHLCDVLELDTDIEVSTEDDYHLPEQQALANWATSLANDMPFADVLVLLTAADGARWYPWMARSEGDGPDYLKPLKHAADECGVDMEAIKAEVQAEFTARAAAQTTSTDGPAAQASGGRGTDGGEGGVDGKGKGAKGEKTPGRDRPAGAARAKARLSAEDAQLGIAAAMQGMEEEGTGDCAGAGSITGAGAQGIEGRATAPDAGASGEAQGDGETVATDASDSEADGDADLQRARALVISEQKVSVRQIKTALSVGTYRALLLIADLERMGVVSVVNERGVRTVLVAGDLAA